MPHLIHKELSYQVRGALLEVYNQLGPSLPESFYRDALTYGLREQGIACEPEKHFEVFYGNTTIGTHYIDLWLENGKLLLELKVAPRLMPIHQAQTLSYLKLTNADFAILAAKGIMLQESKAKLCKTSLWTPGSDIITTHTTY